MLSCIQLFGTVWTVACQVTHSMGFPWQEDEGVAISTSRGVFLTRELNACVLHWQADSLLLSHQGSNMFIVPILMSFIQFKKTLSPVTKPFSCTQMQCATYQQNINQKTKIKLYLSNLFDFALKNNFALFHISLPLMRMLLYWVA